MGTSGFPEWIWENRGNKEHRKNNGNREKGKLMKINEYREIKKYGGNGKTSKLFNSFKNW